MRQHNQVRSQNLPTHRGQNVRLEDRMADPQQRACWENRINDPNAMIVLDLFCGAGGMSLGFEDAGFVVGAGVDMDPDACATHAANILAHTIRLDITLIKEPADFLAELGIPRVDVIIGGPPCQGFSLAGVAKMRSLAAQDPEVRKEVDAKNQLYKQFLRFVELLEPTFFVMENVPNLNYYAQGVVAQDIRNDFAQIGYDVCPEILDASHYGVPQMRRRLFFVGSKVGRIWRLPRPGFRMTPRTVRDAIYDLPVIEAPALQEVIPYVMRGGCEYQQLMRSRLCEAEQALLYDHVARPVRDDDRVIFELMQQGQKYRDIPEAYRRYRSDSFDDKYYKLLWDQPGNTITAHMAKDGYRYIHPEQLRTLSIREAARIQSFPDHFRFAGYRSARFRQIGNAVPPLLAQAIAKSVAAALERYRLYKAGRISIFDLQDDDEGLPGQLGFPDEGLLQQLPGQERLASE